MSPRCIGALKAQVLELSVELNRAVRTKMSLRPSPKQAAKVMSVDPTL